RLAEILGARGRPHLHHDLAQHVASFPTDTDGSVSETERVVAVVVSAKIRDVVRRVSEIGGKIAFDVTRGGELWPRCGLHLGCGLLRSSRPRKRNRKRPPEGAHNPACAHDDEPPRSKQRLKPPNGRSLEQAVAQKSPRTHDVAGLLSLQSR